MDIAIVDDEPLVRQQLEQMLKEYLYHHYPKLMPTASFLEFSNAEDFLPIEQARKFSLIFMDIYMDELNGMDAIRQLRQAGCNTPVIFLTNSTEHLLEGYSVFAAGYLVKPLSASYHRLVQTLDHCMPQVLASFQVLHIMVGHNMTSIPLDSICYLDRNIRRKVQIHLDEQTLSVESSYPDCCEQLLPDPRFIECYHHVLVNMDKICQLDDDDFLLNNGQRVPVSRRKRSEVKHQYMLYLTSFPSLP